MSEKNTEGKPLQPVGNPLEDNVVARAYAEPVASGDATPIEEPTFQRPSFSKPVTPEPAGNAAGAPKSSPGGAPPAVNTALNEAPNADKKAAAEAMAKNALDVYAKLKSGVGSWSSFSPDKINSLAKTGQLDLSLAVPVDANQSLPLSSYIEAYNSSVQEIFKVAPEWRAETELILARVLAKRGLGMTDEQQLMYLFGADIVGTGVVAFKLIKSNNEMLKMWMAQSTRTPPTGTKSEGGNSGANPQNPGGNNPPPSPVQPSTPPPTQSQSGGDAGNATFVKTPSAEKPGVGKNIDDDGYSEPEEVFADAVVVETNLHASINVDELKTTQAGPEFGKPEDIENLNKVAEKLSQE